MFGLSPAHLIIILVILLIIVGPGKLPETGAAIGKAIRGFKDAMEGEIQPGTPPAQPPAPPAQPAVLQSAPVPVAPAPADAQPPVPPAAAPPSA